MTNPTFDKEMRYFHHRADSLETKPELLMPRATDEEGNTQPMSQPYNTEGYLFNSIFSHPITVE